jgi:hypothetical protein
MTRKPELNLPAVVNGQSFVDMAQGGLIFYPEQAIRIRTAAMRLNLTRIAPARVP